MSTETPPPVLLRLHPSDDVAVARSAIVAGTVLAGPDGGELTAAADIPAGHKIATRAVPAGAPVRKYGQVIGVATAAIAAGQHVHLHNLDIGDSHPAHGVGRAYVPTTPVAQPASFDGYVRPDGAVGTRNYVGVISSVNCSATVCKAIEKAFAGDAMAEWPGVDGVVAITHGSGCGMSGSGEGIDLLRRTLRGYAGHPNFAAVLVIGLGCEVNQVGMLVEPLAAAGERVRTLTIQDAGGTREAIAEGSAIVRELLALADAARREKVPASRLVVGLQCGGSDGYSGISANPALGAAVDLLVRHGGSAILSETPEIHGAEHLLTARAARPEIAERLMQRLRWWEDYTAKNGGDMNNNPSPGNKAGGLTTILEKSLGAAAKGGTKTLAAVYHYAEQVKSKGFVYMDTPGYDPVSATGQVAGGANILAFTTGRGSAYGCKPTPSIKLATNTPMYTQMIEDMDINCGDVLDGVSIEDKGREIFEHILKIASGQRSKSEELGYGDAEFVPWQIGATM